MEKVEKIFGLFFSLIEYLIVLGGGAVGATFVWIFLSASEMSTLIKVGITGLSAIIAIFITALVWKVMKIFN